MPEPGEKTEPLPRRRRFDPDPLQLAEVRRFVAQAAGVRFDHPAVVVANELAANAVIHAQTPFTVSVTQHSPIRVEVADLSSPEPVLKPPEVRGGYGLRVVEALSRDWGVEQQAGGKTVWAEVGE